MKNARTHVCFWVIVWFLWPYIAFGQGPLDGYMKGKGNLDVAFSYSGNSAKKFLDGDGNTYNLEYRGSLLSLFAEWGITYNFDLVGVGAMVFTPSLSGLQDGGVYAKYRIGKWNLKNDFRLHVISGLGASFPLTDYQPTVTGALGTKAIVVPARLIFQLETPSGLFFNCTGGYNWRFDEPSEDDIAEVRKTRPNFSPTSPPNYVTYLVKAGFPAAHYYLDAWFEWQVAQGGTSYVPEVADLPQLYGVSYQQIGGTAYYSESGKNGVYLSFGYILGGTNVSKIFRITGGLVIKFTPRH